MNLQVADAPSISRSQHLGCGPCCFVVFSQLKTPFDWNGLEHNNLIAAFDLLMIREWNKAWKLNAKFSSEIFSELGQKQNKLFVFPH